MLSLTKNVTLLRCRKLYHKIVVSQKSAASSIISNMDMSNVSSIQPIYYNSPSLNCSTLSELEKHLVKIYNIKPLSIDIIRLSQPFLDTLKKIKVERDVSEIYDDTNVQETELESQFCITSANDLMEENHRVLGSDVSIKTEVEDESFSNLPHVPFASIDMENLKDEDDLINEVTSELIIKPEPESSDEEEETQDDTEYVPVKKHSIVTDFQCHICLKYYNKRKDVLRHIHRIHNKDKTRIPCKFCNKGMRDEKHRKLHEKYIHQFDYTSAVLKCGECGKIATSRRTLLDHVNKIHTQPALDFTCEICKLISVSKRALRSHILNYHIKLKKHVKCKFCNAKFKIRAQLKNHLRLLNCIELLPIKCEFCSKLFKNENTLNNHSWQYHTGSQVGKKFSCKQCHCKYTRRSLLNKHILKVHKNISETHTCIHCKKCFTSLGVLKVHVKYMHEKRKRFKCEICDRSYVRPTHLKRHMKDAHDINDTFFCVRCEVSFPNKLALTVHKC